MRIADLATGRIYRAELSCARGRDPVLVVLGEGGESRIVERLRSSGWAIVEASQDERRALDATRFYLPTIPSWAVPAIRRMEDEEHPFVW